MKLRKTPQSERTKYVYRYDDGSTVTIEPNGKVTTRNANGEVSVSFDETITEVTIGNLHRADDAEVENNLKSINCEDTAAKQERRRLKKEWSISHPNDNNPYDRPIRNVSLDGISVDYGESIGDKSRLEYELSMLSDGQEEGIYAEQRELVRNAVATFPRSMQELYRLYYEEEYEQHEIAKMLGISKSTVSLRLKKLEERIKKHFGKK